MIDIDLLHPRTIEAFTTTRTVPRRRWPVISLIVVLLVGAAIGATLVVPAERQPPIMREAVHQVQTMATRVLAIIRP